jgi:hypothetical protein
MICVQFTTSIKEDKLGLLYEFPQQNLIVLDSRNLENIIKIELLKMNINYQILGLY